MAKAAQRTDYVRSETDLFSEPGYDISLLSSCRTEHHPHSSITETGPIEFIVQGNDTQYVDLSKTRLKLTCKVVNEDGSDIAAAPVSPGDYKYAPVNNLIGSAFERVTVHLNGTEVTPKASLYPYQAYLETLLSYGSDYKKGQAEAAGYYRVEDETSDSDKGLEARQAVCLKSKQFEISGRPHGELFGQTRFLMPGIDIQIRFDRSTNAFCMVNGGTIKKKVKLSIISAKLYMQKISLLPSIHMAHLKMWKTQPCVYPGKRVEMKSYSLPIGTFQHTNENLLNGLIPDRLIIGLVATTNVQGSHATNPFNFASHGLEQIIITCNTETPTQHIINVDEDENRYVDGFISLFDAMGISNCDNGLDLKLKEYIKGKTLYGFDLRNLSDGFAIPRHGNSSIYLKFKTQLAASLTVIVYPEYPSVMYISGDKQVYFKDYAREY